MGRRRPTSPTRRPDVSCPQGLATFALACTDPQRVHAKGWGKGELRLWVRTGS